MWWLILVGLICTSVPLWLLFNQYGKSGDATAVEGTASQSTSLSQKDAPVLAVGMAVPDIFNEQRILADLIKLSEQPLLFDQYVTRVKKRFTNSNQIALLNNWKNLYDSATSTIEAKTKLRRAQNEFTQLETEDEVQRREKEVKLASLAADETEQRLRQTKAQRDMEDLRSSSAGKSTYERQMDEAWTKEKAHLTWEIKKHAKRIAQLEALAQWFNDELANIHRNKRLTPEQQTELVQELQKIYEEEKSRIKNHQLSPGEGGPDPEESIFTH